MSSADLSTIFAHRPTRIEIDLPTLQDNLRKFKTHVAPAKVLAVLKANAYGHGIEECAKAFESAGADYFGVAYVEEGIQLRKAGVRTPTLIFGGLLNEQVSLYLNHDLDITASSVMKLEAIEEAAARAGKRARVHLKIDTGMERLGVHYYSAESLLEKTLTLRHTDVVGVFSHFARAEDEDNLFSKLQLERFLECLEFFPRHSLPLPIRHIANSAAILKLKETHLDMVRPGIALYGVMPDSRVQNVLDLQPALALKSKVVYFKVVKEGHGVSYGHSFVPKDWTRVVTLPIGYGDGYFRSLSNKGEVLIRGKRYPIVGTICMDQLMVDIGRDEAFNDDEVVLIGRQGAEEIRAGDVAAKAGTISYEILVNLNARVPRVF